jgi:hypothetical protein
MPGHPCKESSGGLALEAASREAASRAEGEQTESGELDELEWMLGETEWAEQRRSQLVPIRYQGIHQAAIRISVIAEPLCRSLDRAFDYDGPAVVQGMSESSRWLDPVEAVFRKRERAEER